MTKYGRINDEDRGNIAFNTVPHLVELADLLNKNRLLIILKARQIYITWFMAHYALWTALFHQGAKVLILSRNEDAAGEVLNYCNFIHSQLPDGLKYRKGKDQASIITFPAANSQIRALPSTQKSGIGFGGARLVILDEWAFHPYAKENYPEIKPMIDAGGNRQLVILSAPNKEEDDSKFNEIWHAARQGLNNFYPLYLSYNPYGGIAYRDEKWLEAMRVEYPDPLDFATRYHSTEQEALTSTRDLCRFDYESIQAMMAQDTFDPIETRYNGLVKIYERAVAGNKYYFPIDPSEGDGDPSLGLVFDWRTDREVAEFHGNISVDEQARIAWELYREYNEAYCAPERNADGRRLIEKLQNFGIQNFYYCAKEKPGWWTHGQNRPVMIGELAEATYNRTFKIRNRAGLREFLTFIRTKKKPEGEATKGTHDEYVIASAIGLQVKKYMPVGEMRVISIRRGV